MCGMENASPENTPGGSRVLLWIVAVAFFMQMLDGTILNTALPTIARDMGVSPLRMQAVIIAYILTMALVIPAAGWLSDRFGAKRIFIGSILVFMLGSLLCALSPGLDFMIFARVVQGVGGAVMVPVGRLAAIRSYPRSELVQVLSFITIPGLVGPLLGPVAGGLLVQYVSWHWIFFINIPVGAAGVLFAVRFMPEIQADAPTDRFDWTGFLVFGAAMILISMAMEGFGELRLPKVESTLMCIAGLGLMILYWVRAGNVERPLFSTSLFRTRSFAVGIMGNMFSRLGSGAMPFLMPLFLQMGLGFSPLKAGLGMIPAAAAGMMGKSLVKPLVRRFGLRGSLVVNTLALGAMISGFALVDGDTSYALILVHLCLFGFVNSFQFTIMNTVTLLDLADEQTTEGNGLLSVVMQLSACCGVAMAAALMDGFMARYGGGHSRESLMRVFAHTFVWVGVLSVATSAIFSQLPRDRGRG